MTGESDKAVVGAQVRQQWPGEKFSVKRGHFVVPPVREGGATDMCIDLVIEIADAHYRKVIRDLLDDEDGSASVDSLLEGVLKWLDEQ